METLTSKGSVTPSEPQSEISLSVISSEFFPVEFLSVMESEFFPAEFLSVMETAT